MRFPRDSYSHWIPILIGNPIPMDMFRTCEIYTNIAIVVQKLQSFLKYLVLHFFKLSRFRYSETGETDIEVASVEFAKTVSVLTNGSRCKLPTAVTLGEA